MRFAVPWLIGVVVALLCARLNPAQAASTHAAGNRPLQARTQLDFRIVIPQALRLPSLNSRRDAIGRNPRHTVETRRDRVVVTVSMP